MQGRVTGVEFVLGLIYKLFGQDGQLACSADTPEVLKVTASGAPLRFFQVRLPVSTVL